MIRSAGYGGKMLCQKALDALREHGPMTMDELAAASGRSLSTCRWEIAAHRKAGRVRIAAWREPKRRGKWAPVYGLGSEPDAVLVTPEKAVHDRRYRKRVRIREAALLRNDIARKAAQVRSIDETLPDTIAASNIWNWNGKL